MKHTNKLAPAIFPTARAVCWKHKLKRTYIISRVAQFSCMPLWGLGRTLSGTFLPGNQWWLPHGGGGSATTTTTATTGGGRGGGGGGGGSGYIVNEKLKRQCQALCWIIHANVRRNLQLEAVGSIWSDDQSWPSSPGFWVHLFPATWTWPSKQLGHAHATLHIAHCVHVCQSAISETTSSRFRW